MHLLIGLVDWEYWDHQTTSGVAPSSNFKLDGYFLCYPCNKIKRCRSLWTDMDIYALESTAKVQYSVTRVYLDTWNCRINSKMSFNRHNIPNKNNSKENLHHLSRIPSTFTGSSAKDIISHSINLDEIQIGTIWNEMSWCVEQPDSSRALTGKTTLQHRMWNAGQNFCCSTFCWEELQGPEAPAVTPITVVTAGVWRLTVDGGPCWSLIGVQWKVQHSPQVSSQQRLCVSPWWKLLMKYLLICRSSPFNTLSFFHHLFFKSVFNLFCLAWSLAK